jgi:hypothetical protein
MKRLLFILTAFLPLMSALPAAPPADTFARGQKDATFNFEMQEGLIVLQVRVNGSRPLAFVLDTGSSRNLIDRALAESLGLKATGTGSLQGAGTGRVPISFIQNVRVSLPGLESTGYDFSTIDLGPLNASIGIHEDGLLGYEVLKRFVVTVDYSARRITFVSPTGFRPDPKSLELPIEIRNKWPFVKGDLVLPGNVTVQDSFLIDSGSSDSVDHPIVMTMQSRKQTTSGVGLGEPVQGAVAQATAFRLGRLSVASPTVVCCGATDATSKLIGSEILRHFTVTFDYPSSRIFLTPNGML